MKNPLFKKVSPNAIKELLELSSRRIYKHRTCVLDTHDVSYYFFFVITGKVKVYVYDQNCDRQLTLTLLGPKDVFSVMSLFGALKRKVYYETLEQTELLCIPLPEMKAWVSKNQEFSQALLQYMAHKIQNLENSVTDLVMEDIPTRLAKLFLNNVNPDTGNLERVHDLSHEEIASLIGTTRSVVNRHINAMKRDGVIAVQGKQIKITCHQALQNQVSNNLR